MQAIGRDLQKFAAFDFSGGLNAKDSAQRLASFPKFRRYLTQARNTVSSRAGAVTKRPDAVTYNASSLGASVICIGGFQFRPSGGTTYNVAAFNDGTVRRLNTDGTTTTLKSGLLAATQASFCNFNNLMIYTDRTNPAQSWDATTWQALAGSPPALAGPAAVHGNRVVMLDATNDRRVSWSKLDDPQDYTTASNAGSMVVTGRLASSPLVTLQPMTSELLLLHRDFVTRLQGTSPSTYAITNAVPAQVSQGAISTLGAIFSNNDARWISQRGIHTLHTTLDFGDLKERFESSPIDPYFVAGSGLTLSLNQLTSAAACYDSQNNRDLFAVDSDGDGQNDTILCRDVYTGGWSIWDGFKAACLWTAYTGANGVEVFAGGYDGYVRRLAITNTTAISGSFKHISDLGLPFWQKTVRHIYVYVKEQSAATMQVTTNFDFGYTGGQTYSFSTLGTSDVLGSTFVLGTSVLGARSQIVKRLDTTGTGEFLELQFANSQSGQPFTVNGYEVMHRPRRQVARAATT